MSRGACVDHSARSSSTTSSSSSSSSTSSQACAATLEVPSIQKLVRTIFRSTRITVRQAERLQSRLHQVYLTKLADGNSLVLKCPPATHVRLLRHEKNSLETECMTLETLHEYTQLPVPRIIKYDHHGGQFGAPYILMSHLPGRRLSEVSSHLTSSELRRIDWTLGVYVRNMTALSAAQFGMTHQMVGQTGSKSWREAFLVLLEAALRDAEDILVTIPYDSIRYYIGRHSHVLDDVTEPRLVALDACEPENVLINEYSKHVTGLVGFSTVIWGDALMSGGFANGSDAFFEGFGERPVQNGNAKARILMYTVYRATLKIIAHHYRPQTNIDELEVRRSLTCALNDLARI